MEMLHQTYQEGVRPGVALQVVDLGLLYIANITYAQVGCMDGKVECQELAKGRLVVQGGETDVLAPVV